MSAQSLTSSVTTQTFGINNVTYLVLTNHLSFSKYRAHILSHKFYGVARSTKELWELPSDAQCQTEQKHQNS